ncbi:hypothetical protein [Pseudomonas syringae]|uniref:hypothetical protein n=1 Tax=Pseudomonas syringae TaxID=317 RepID=UPI001F0F95CE|nr:hypothetical protein [Pseudomonas syringae]MCH5532120.1 hypothetical protein [Pseudomonas syringae pv. syringae]MCH5542228.1 hypothetical protein [Pseudomonas syringae pv. syringae]MCH5547549.1 hypothetical protein [Pseudomonas syringae pv. syringae]MCH5605896.1 hypothetical protein [Pseudomonas syringae pv. syringae]MCH5610530.1 hypothetical protein [Pseudomonas syringae pv. syringae]
MNQLSPNLREDLLEVLYEVSTLMSAAYAQLGPILHDHPLAQSGLENGAETVIGYIAHGEVGVALDHHVLHDQRVSSRYLCQIY